jgi:hypothetical protein
MVEFTLEDIRDRGLAPTMELLVQSASDGGLVTYGQLAKHLNKALSFVGITPHHVGHVAGPLMDRIQEVAPDAPLLNLMVVRGDSLQPGEGATSYLRARYRVRGRLGSKSRAALVQQGLNEVWAYQGWPAIYERLFNQPLGDKAEPPPELFDDDGQADNPKYQRGGRGGLPESAEHKALKQFVLENPGRLRIGLKDPVGQIERSLLSGDKMDVEFVDGPRRIGVEVKSIMSGWPDLRRGIYQCIKYRAVMVAQSSVNADDALCEAILVTEEPLPNDLATLARSLEITHRVIQVN